MMIKIKILVSSMYEKVGRPMTDYEVCAELMRYLEQRWGDSFCGIRGRVTSTGRERKPVSMKARYGLFRKSFRAVVNGENNTITLTCLKKEARAWKIIQVLERDGKWKDTPVIVKSDYPEMRD